MARIAGPLATSWDISRLLVMGHHCGYSGGGSPGITVGPSADGLLPGQPTYSN